MMMKRLLLTLLLAPGVLWGAEARIALQAEAGNTTGNPANTNGTWNPFTNPGTTDGTQQTLTSDLKNFSDGTSLNWSLAFQVAGSGDTDGFVNGENSIGSGDTSWVDEAIVSDEYWADDLTHTFTIGGLDNAKTYTVAVTGSRAGTGTIRQTDITLGGSTQTYDADGNTSSQARFTSVSPSSNQISFTAALGTTNDGFLRVSAIRVTEEAPSDSTAPAESAAPAVDTVAATSLIVDATYTEETDATYNFYVVALANGATAPSGAQVEAGTDGNDSAAVATCSDTAVTSGVEAQCTLSGLTASTDYDIYTTARDSSNNYVAPALINQGTKPAVSSVTPPTIAANGTDLTITFTEAMTSGTGSTGGFILSSGETATYSSGTGTDTIVFTLSGTVLQGATPTLTYNQPNDGWQSTDSQWLDSFSGTAVTNNSTQTSGSCASNDVSPVPGTTISITGCPAFAGNITTLTSPGGDTISAEAGASTTAADFIIPAHTAFVSGQSMQDTEWDVDGTWTVGDGTTTENITLQVDPPDTDGPTYWFGSLTGVAVDSVCPALAASGDEYFVEETSGTITDVNTLCSVESSTADYETNARVWDESANAGSGQWSAVENTVFDGTAPTISSASIPAAGTSLSVTFDESVTQGAGYSDGDWTVNASGGAVALTYSSGDGTTSHTFTTSRTIEQGETVTLDWAGTANGLEDAVGNDLATVSGQAVTNNSTADTDPPAFSSASIPAAGTSITVNFDQAVTRGVGYSDGDWTISASGGAVTVTYASGDGTSSHSLTTSRPILSGETVTIQWAGTANGLEDGAGNDLAAFGPSAVSNNSTQAVPTFSSASIPAAGTSITLNFSEAITIGVGGNGGVTLSASGGAVTATYSSGDTTSALVYTLSRTIEQGETVTVSYTQPGNGFEDSVGLDVASFSNQAVTNSSTQDTTAPTLSRAEISESTLSLTFDEAVTRGAGYLDGGWTLTCSGGAVAPTYSSGDGLASWQLSLDRAVGDETCTLDWGGAVDGIEDGAGNDLAAFSGTAVSVGGDVCSMLGTKFATFVSTIPATTISACLAQ